MAEFWDSRYATTEYIYGKTPNDFIKEKLSSLTPGKALFAAEGEGRNAVFAAGLGFEVFAFDASEVAKTKALDFAASLGLKINYKTAKYQEVVYPENQFDILVLVFAHMPAQYRSEWHRKLIRYLKPGGKLILEGFAKNQIEFNSGGPKELSMLFSKAELQGDFAALSDLEIEEKTRVLNEGSHHKGMASVIQLYGTK
ncbi:MAG TPA: methyltransferase domain-containing protein [Bacteroidales bacterium]|nr:methyltransferase domain-containing protein [Bacteroidales bacterium]HRX96858.1 methyltransferase domain-containing protein [Bacteroidales bacterium]